MQTPSPPALWTPRTPPPAEQVIRHLLHANEVGRQAMAHGHHPFGAILVAPDGETVLTTQGNVSTVEHAETVLLQRAARDYSPAFLWNCSLYTNVEPCAMCSGTMYWANVGCVGFGMTERRLLDLTGSDPENPTMSLAAHTVFEHGQKPIALIGPVAEVEEAVIALHLPFWGQLR